MPPADVYLSDSTVLGDLLDSQEHRLEGAVTLWVPNHNLQPLVVTATTTVRCCHGHHRGWALNCALIPLARESALDEDRRLPCAVGAAGRRSRPV